VSGFRHNNPTQSCKTELLYSSRFTVTSSTIGPITLNDWRYPRKHDFIRVVPSADMALSDLSLVVPGELPLAHDALLPVQLLPKIRNRFQSTHQSECHIELLDRKYMCDNVLMCMLQ